jgi:hypothetical protein
MNFKIILLFVFLLSSFGASALIIAGQYLYKENYIKSGFRQIFYNSTVDEFPVHPVGKKFLFWGQILAAIAIVCLVVLFVF